jgi:RNA polymerase sigma-70 factor (ECF subfamily)
LLEEERFKSLVASFDQEHTRLIRLCARLTGSRDSAEDLAQETLVEAWRNRQKWTGYGSSFAWLSRIAVNVCWRWRRSRGRDSERLTEAPEEGLENLLIAPSWQAELEQSELLDLLDRALDTLPEPTRALMVAKYVEDTPLSELSVRLGATTGTLAVRLHRGRQALQEVLKSRFRDDAIAYGLISESDASWIETKLWCATCGTARLQALRDPQDCFFLRCPHCFPQTGQYFECVDLATRAAQRILGEAQGFRTMQSRLDAAGFRYCQQALERGQATCAYCGKPARVGCLAPEKALQTLPGGFNALRGEYVLTMQCDNCTAPTLAIGLSRLLLGAPEAQAFWKATPRLRRTPDLEVVFAGAPAIRTRYENVAGGSALEIYSQRDTFKLLSIRQE